MTNILYYISGHGYGHAVRSAEIIRVLTRRQPDWRIHIKTSAPCWLFDHLTGVNVISTEIDPGMVEHSPIQINQTATMQRAAAFLEQVPTIVAAECGWVRREKISLIIADIPWLAGEIGSKSGVPAVGVGNFLWDWIYEPLCAVPGAPADLLEAIRAGYAKLRALLKLPFAHAMNTAGNVIEAPLVVRQSERTRAEILNILGVDPADRRPLVYLGMRDWSDQAALHRAAAAGSEFIFVTAEPISSHSIENLRHAALGAGLNFADVVSVSGTVISKPGYGVAASCVASGVGLLYPRRSGFREDEVLLDELARYTRIREIPGDDFASGDWCGHLRDLRQQPCSGVRPATNGAEVCAQWFADHAGALQGGLSVLHSS
jgi:hypothetical protein